MTGSYSNRGSIFIASLLFSLLLGGAAHATFSILAYDPEVGEWGIAVASREIAVGHGVPWARAGAGAVATQALINPLYGRDGLAMMEAGFSAEQTLRALLDREESKDSRQIAIIDADGNTAEFNGAKIGKFYGDRRGECYSIQGNCLTGEEVLLEMEKAYLETKGPLALRLLEALRAGDAAGGDKRGRQSASLLVVRKNGGLRGVTDRFIDLRIDNHPEAPEELMEAFEQWAYQIMLYFYVESGNESDNDRGLVLLDWILSREKAKDEPNENIYYTIADRLSAKRLYPERTLEIALETYRMVPDNAYVLALVAEAYFADRDTATALEWNRKAREANPESKYIKKQYERLGGGAQAPPAGPSRSTSLGTPRARTRPNRLQPLRRYPSL